MSKAFENELKDSPVQAVEKFEVQGISFYVKREDMLHPYVSGNKYRKLKYNLLEAAKQEKKVLLTFGGAFSNHIAAVAAAGFLQGFKTVGVIRGDELGKDMSMTLKSNPTLQFAASRGMEFFFVSREQYREKEKTEFIEELKARFGDFFLIPEGGTNTLAVKGCEEILGKMEEKFDFVCCPVGTGGTISGLINSSVDQQILGFPALKGEFISEEIKKYTHRTNWRLVQDYHFGGYGKISEELVRFINDFRRKYQISLDPVYTGKMFFGIFDLVEKSAFPRDSHILAIHTGGLQGIQGMNRLLLKKKLPLIDV